MPRIQCPIEGCEYETPDVEAVLAAALITTHATSHRTTSRSTQTARVEKVKRPNVLSAGTTEDWQFFKSRWNDYVKATRLEGTDRIIQLLECCDDQLRKDLTRNAGGILTEVTEDEVFTAMRKLTIREENTMVARVTLHNMRQDRDEPIRAYGARLRGQASVCKFTQQCTGCEANVDYTEAMIKDVLCRGLEDTEIQMQLLGDKNQDMTLEQVLRFVEAKEAGKRSASHLLLPQATDAVTGSSYRRQKRPSAKGPPPKDQDTCTYCGTRGHGRNPPTRVRRTECPAFGDATVATKTITSLTDVRSWFGLVNQVSYAFSMADTMLPFRELLKPSNKFHWDDTLQQAFEQSKLTIINEIHNGVKIFDKTKPTCLATDWSKHGIGYWLFQKHCSCPSNDLFCCKQGWKITLVGSRFTQDAESRYAPIEGEALAVADALDKARHFVLGCKNLTIAVDHRPLLKIFGDRSLDHICHTRLRNLKEKTLRYHFKMVHIPGVKNRAPDTLSRHPTGDHHPPKMVLHDDIHSIQDSTVTPPPHIPTQLIASWHMH